MDPRISVGTNGMSITTVTPMAITKGRGSRIPIGFLGDCVNSSLRASDTNVGSTVKENKLAPRDVGEDVIFINYQS